VKSFLNFEKPFLYLARALLKKSDLIFLPTSASEKNTELHTKLASLSLLSDDKGYENSDTKKEKFGKNSLSENSLFDNVSATITPFSGFTFENNPTTSTTVGFDFGNSSPGFNFAGNSSATPATTSAVFSFGNKPSAPTCSAGTEKIPEENSQKT